MRVQRDTHAVARLIEADEERGHAAQLERMIAALPANGLHLLEEDDEPHMPE